MESQFNNDAMCCKRQSGRELGHRLMKMHSDQVNAIQTVGPQTTPQATFYAYVQIW